MSKLKLKQSTKLSRRPSKRSQARARVRKAISDTGAAMKTAVGATSWAIGQAATGGEFGRMMNGRLDKKVHKELTTKGISKKK